MFLPPEQSRTGHEPHQRQVRSISEVMYAFNGVDQNNSIKLRVAEERKHHSIRTSFVGAVNMFDHTRTVAVAAQSTLSSVCTVADVFRYTVCGRRN